MENNLEFQVEISRKKLDNQIRKKFLHEQMQKIETKRKAKIYQVDEIERQVNNLKITKNSTFSKLTNRSTQGCYLEQLKNLQAKAKELLDADPFFASESRVLNKANLEKLDKSLAPIRIPVLVPQSVLHKSKKIQPPMMQKVLKSGEVCNVYLVSDSSPAYNPLVLGEVSLDRFDLKRTKKFYGKVACGDVERWKSIGPIRKKKAKDLDLAQADLVNLREATPQMRLQRYMFKDYSNSQCSNYSSRHWVGSRMKIYSDFIKNFAKPIVSEKKQMELTLLKEKLKKPVFSSPHRIKLIV